MHDEAVADRQLTVFVDSAGLGLCGPFFDGDGFLHFLSQTSGNVVTVNENRTVTNVCNSGGQPSGAVLDKEGLLYVADLAHGAVVTVKPDGKHQVVVGVYEDKPFKGPNSIACDDQGTIYFTDSGPLGETGLHNSTGSLYCISRGGRNNGGQMLLPLALECLAYPSGVAVSPDGRCVYVAEQMANRILRFVQGPNGAFLYTVFHQFAGGLGPTCLTCDGEGSIYVGRFDYVGAGARAGVVSVLSTDGAVQSEILVPGPEITGLAISPDGRGLFITEASTQCVYRMSV